ncbi:MAG: phosphopyruvate hydratase, partial [Candidatus Micrarchaeia archaeon]
LFVTNKERLKRGIELGACNAILIKPNQIGTISDMIDTVMLAKRNNYQTVISHRSGESEDATIAHLAVGLGIEYIKTGTVGGERTAKHNELIRIEEKINRV